MPPERRVAIDPQLANLDRDGMLELCQSLADYAEAGGLSRDLMLRAGRHATVQWPADIEVLLAVGRMYRLGGELSRARATLVQGGKIAARDARQFRPRSALLLHLLREVLDALDVTDSPEDALAEAFDEPVRARPQAAGAPKQ